jgi:hypothetical protein
MLMPKWWGMATPMVRGMAHTTGSAAGGVNVMGKLLIVGIGVRQDHDGHHDVQLYTIAS